MKNDYINEDNDVDDYDDGIFIIIIITIVFLLSL